jgi:GNAT superfamily N-acetyltransferase
MEDTKLQITTFTTEHIEQAARIAKRNYETERGRVPALPPVADWPDLSVFARNGLGAAAFGGDGEMTGFLCCWDPFDGAFGIPGLRGVFSPMHANGTVPENRAAIYARLYQAAGEKWARAGAGSHGVCLYAHDAEGQAQFFRYGFGMRCVDAIRPMEDLGAPACEGYVFSELAPEDALEVLPLEKQLNDGYIESPFFVRRETGGEAAFLSEYAQCRPVCFAARHEGRPVAYLRAEQGGETFIQDTPGYLHITGAFCLPEHRAKGLSQALLGRMIRRLQERGYTRLGVDYESVNPSGFRFWQKHFSAYTCGVVRRIDEGAVGG